MKTLALTFMCLAALAISAQQRNDNGIFVNAEGDPFSGVIITNSNGSKSEITVKEGVISGDATYYYTDGNVMEKGIYTDGKKDRKWIRFNENGTIAAVAFYNHGNKTGTWMVYDEHGKKRFEMNYDNGQKTGVWTNWDENGAIVNTKDYSKMN